MTRRKDRSRRKSRHGGEIRNRNTPAPMVQDLIAYEREQLQQRERIARETLAAAREHYATVERAYLAGRKAGKDQDPSLLQEMRATHNLAVRVLARTTEALRDFEERQVLDAQRNARRHRP